MKSRTLLWILLILLIAIIITGIVTMLMWATALFLPLFILFIILVIIFLLLLCWWRSLEDKEERAKPEPKPKPKPKTTTTRRRTAPRKRITGTKPVEEVEGIGEVYGGRLRKAGIKYVEQLGKATATKVATTCDVPKETAQKWVYMARLLALPSVGEEDAEALVLACKVHTVKALADSDPASLYRKITRAVAAGKVIVPSGYEFTRKMAETWVKEAKSKS